MLRLMVIEYSVMVLVMDIVMPEPNQNDLNAIFNEDKLCLDTFLVRFQRMCTAYQVDKSLWAMTLSRRNRPEYTTGRIIPGVKAE